MVSKSPKSPYLRIWRRFLRVGGFLLTSLTLTIIIYGLFALFFKTDTERKLSQEIKRYKEIYPTLAPQEELLRDAIAGLQHKDSHVYSTVFHSEAPDVNPMGWLDSVQASDTIPDTRLTSYTSRKSDSLLVRAKEIEAHFQKVFKSLADTAFVMPPMAMPLKDISYTQIGASIGHRMNPVYKAYVWHNGLDLIAARGTAVYATADGVVSDTINSKDTGYTVEIIHEGGYKTIYAHLENIRKVRKGMSVKVGDEIGSVGMSGTTLAPHLHYEILKDDLVLDPVNYLFASVSSDDYANMLFMAVNTIQTMD